MAANPSARTRRRWLPAVLTVLILIGALGGAYWWHAQDEELPSPRTLDVPNLDEVPLTIVPGVHCLGGMYPSAVYVIETSGGLVLIDSGLEPEGGSLKAEMAQLGLDWKAVRAICLTHVHADHSQGAEHLRQETGAKVYAGRGDAAALRAGGPREVFCSIFYMPQVTIHPTTVDGELRGGETLRFGDVSLEVLAMPGHTSGSICYLMKRGRLRVLFAGDVIMSLAGDARADARLARPLGTYPAYLPPRHHGSARAYLASLRKLRALPAPDLVLPGHPRLDAVPQNPVMTQKRWEALLYGGIQEMETLLARYKRDGALFLDGTPRTLLPDLYYLGDYQGTMVYAFRASSKFYVVDAPGGPGLSDFLKQRLQQLGVKDIQLTAVLLTGGDGESTNGLRDLVEKTGAQVVVASAAVGKVKEICPKGTVVVPAEELPMKGWLEVKVVPLGGRGLGPVAYQLRWGGKTVLFSGRMPVDRTYEALQGLYKDLGQSAQRRADYAAALDRLSRLKPDLWLPALPAFGRNANVYDDEWNEILRQNRSLLVPSR
jgi:glyoxylase-like metal-dependent hydrolase (beta-lactamase superfamily II)